MQEIGDASLARHGHVTPLVFGIMLLCGMTTAMLAASVAGGVFIVAVTNPSPPWWMYFAVIPTALYVAPMGIFYVVGIWGWIFAAIVQLVVIRARVRSRLLFAMAGAIAACGTIIIDVVLVGHEPVSGLKDYLADGILPSAMIGGFVGGSTAWWVRFREIATL